MRVEVVMGEEGEGSEDDEEEDVLGSENDLDSEEEEEVQQMKKSFCHKEDFFNKRTKGFPLCPACLKSKMSGKEYRYNEILRHAEDVAARGKKGKVHREAHRLLAQRLRQDDIRLSILPGQPGTAQHTEPATAVTVAGSAEQAVSHVVEGSRGGLFVQRFLPQLMQFWAQVRGLLCSRMFRR